MTRARIVASIAVTAALLAPALAFAQRPTTTPPKRDRVALYVNYGYLTGTEDVHPVKFGSPAIDYATGMTGAFALSAALFQRERTGRGQRIDMAMRTWR